MLFLCLGALLVAGAAENAFARIKLTTLPVRQRVEIQLENPRATLVEEERIVTLLEGANQIDFSWSNTAPFLEITSPSLPGARHSGLKRALFSGTLQW